MVSSPTVSFVAPDIQKHERRAKRLGRISISWGNHMDRCPGKVEVPTEKEREALAKLKSIKESVRALKQRLKTLQADCGKADSREILGLKEELALLKEKWERWDKKRQEAQEERMVLLGHR